MTAVLLGHGTAVPEHKMSQEQAAELACKVVCDTPRQQKLIRALYRKSGVQNRHTIVPYTIAYEWAGENGNGAARNISAEAGRSMGATTDQRMRFYEAHALPLATRAASLALADANVAPDRISHLVTVSCTGFVAPGVDVHLIDALGLRDETERVNVGFMGCHGAINGLRVARGLLAADRHAHVLLCAVEVCSMHYRFGWDPQRNLGNLLFADGAAALVLGPEESAPQPAWQLAATASHRVPGSADAMTWRVGDHGFEMTLSAEVPNLIRANLRDWLLKWLDSQRLTLDDIGCWVVHPGGPRILTAVEQSLELPDEAIAVSREVLRELGNMSSPTVLFILERLRQRGAKPPCVMLGFGPGLVAEAALWK